MREIPELKVGDKIAYTGRYADVNGPTIVTTIDKVTPTQYVCGHMRFLRDSLRIVGSRGYGPFEGRIPTEKDLFIVRLGKARYAMANFVVDADNIEAVEAFLESQKR